MTPKRDFYEILCVDRNAPQDEIKRAYRKLAIKYHPDKNPGSQEAESKFKEAAEAYSVLGDPEKRSRYDRFGHAGVGTSAASSGGFGGFDPSTFADFQDILGDFFGFGGDIFGRSGRRAARGSDLRYQLTISFDEMVKGATPTIRIPRLSVCPDCQGSGAEGASGRESCTDCGGRGQVAYRQGFFTIARPCPRCSGTGSILKTPCKNCRGEGRVHAEKSLNVTIPAGIETGARIRLRGQGEAGPNGAPPGDLYVDIRVEEHSKFQREGPHVTSHVSISFPDAALGTRLTVETPTGGTERIEIPAGTQTGTHFRLRGKGLKRLDGYGTGDLYVITDLRTPSKLSRRERELYRGLLDETAEHADEPKGQSIFEKVKKIFG